MKFTTKTPQRLATRLIALTSLTTLSLSTAVFAQSRETTPVETPTPRTRPTQVQPQIQPQIQPGVIQSPTSGTGPSLAQLGSTQAYVPMKHGNCDGVVDCSIHKLATTSGNLDMKAKVGMTCPENTTVTYLAYKPEGQNTQTLIDGSTNSSSRVLNITMQPFSLDDLEKAGQEALGGGWPIPGSHNNDEKTVKKTLKKSIQVWGKCSGWANQQMKAFPVTLTVTFEDKDFPIPPEG